MVHYENQNNAAVIMPRVGLTRHLSVFSGEDRCIISYCRRSVDDCGPKKGGVFGNAAYAVMNK